MRNLKRALSLGLTAAMISGLMVMGSSAASYADVTSEDNQEAIEVLQAVEIMVGDENGDFNPDQNVTRNEMAVIMANLMAYNVASYKNTSPFTDVPSWAEPYVAACYTNGITSGYNATTYGGSDTVTTAQAALMLMKALGYFQYNSDFGADWQLSTVRQGNNIDLFSGVDSGVEEAMTRNDVAQLVLNTLKSGTVQAETNGSLTVGNVTIATDVKYNYITSNQTYANAISSDKSTSNTTDANRSIVELGEKLYNGDLKLDEDTTDVFGRPARTWSYEGEEIGTFAQKELLAAEFTTAVSGKELYDVVGKTAFDKYNFESYVDGEENDFYKEIARNNRGDIDETGNGALTQVFVDTDDEIVTATIINTYLAQATSDYNEKKDTVNFKIYGLDKVNSDTVSGEDFDIVDVEKDDFALVTYSYHSEAIESIDDVEILSEVEISRFTSDDEGGNQGKKVSSVTAEGTKYDASEKLDYEENTLKDYTKDNLKDSTYNIYLDQYGYAIGVELVEGADNYVFITGIDTDSSNLTTKNFEANAIFLDGTSGVIDVKNNDAIATALDALKDADDGKWNLNTWFTYTVNSSNVYTLGTVASKLDVDNGDDVAQHHTTAKEVPEIDDRHISLNGATGDGKIYGNDDSIYLIAELDTINKGGTHYAVISGVDDVATGIDNVSVDVMSSDDVARDLSTDKVPVKAGKVGGTFALYDEDGYVIAAVVIGESAGVSQNIVFALDSKASSESYSDGLWTWTRDVIINGEEVELTETDDDSDESYLADTMQGGHWWIVKYDADGNVKKVEPFESEDEYVKTLKAAATKVAADEDLVVVDVNNAMVDYTNGGRTVFNHNNKDVENGIRIDANVKIVFQQVTNNRTTTDYYEGYDSLASILDELNEKNDPTDKNEGYRFAAVIEDGRATSVIIIDDNHNTDHDSPDGQPVKKGSLELTGVTYSDGAYHIAMRVTKEIKGAATWSAEITTESGAKVASAYDVAFKTNDWAVGSEPVADVTGAKKAAEELKIVVTFYDADGDVLATGEDFLAI